jgi:hypothetical protein
MPLARDDGATTVDKQILAAAKKRTPAPAPRPAPAPAPRNPPAANVRQSPADSTSRSNPPAANTRLNPADVSRHYNPPVDNVRASSANTSDHENPVPKTLYGPGREDALKRKAFKKDARQEAKAAGKTLPLGEPWRETIAEMARQLNQRKG